MKVCHCTLAGTAACIRCPNNSKRDFYPTWDQETGVPGYPFIPIPVSIPTGWVCPICRRVNAPFVLACPCEHDKEKK